MVKHLYIETNNNFEALNCNDELYEYIGKKELDNIRNIIPEHDFVTLEKELPQIKVGETIHICFRMLDKEGKYYWMASKAHRSEHVTSIIRLDIYDLRTTEMDSAEGFFDNMTGVLSKSAITDYAKKLMQQTPRKQFYYFLMDVDNFKSINDTYGHMKGDDVIIDVAQIAKECVGDKGVVGRIGGDEFALVLEKIHEEPELREVLRAIRYNVREKYADEDNNYTITTSLGGGLFPDDASSYTEMFNLADKMLYIAKAKGRDRYIIYTPSVHGDIKDETELITLAQRTMQNKTKNTLIMDLMSGFLLKDDISLREAFEKVIATYGLDEIYIVDKATGKSSFGLTSGGKECDIDLSSLDPKDYQPLFETYPIKVINMYDLQKENYLKFSEFMILNRFRIIIVYYMKNVAGGSYLMYASNTDSACRFAETDFSDLTYFSKMLELSGKLL